MAETKTSFFHQAARASWVAPVIAIGANVLLRNLSRLDERVAIIGILLVVLYLLGLVLGMVAMAGIPQHGRRGILIPALIGILLNGGILTIVAAIVIANL